MINLYCRTKVKQQQHDGVMSRKLHLEFVGQTWATQSDSDRIFNSMQYLAAGSRLKTNKNLLNGQVKSTCWNFSECYDSVTES